MENRLPRILRIMCWFAVACAIIAIVLVNSLHQLEKPHTEPGSNINQLAKALQMYADDNGGRFPFGASTPTENLWLLYSKYLSDERTLINPRGGMTQRSIPRSNAPNTKVPPEWIAATAFVYREGFSVNDVAEIILYEKSPKNGERLVAIGAGTIEWVPEAEFQKRLDAQIAANAGRLNAAPAAAVPPSPNP